MRAMISGLADQLRWARDLPAITETFAHDEVLVVGMGGSGIAGDVAAAVNPGRRITVVKDYGLPAWAPAVRPLVAVVSYSGATEEALEAKAAADELALPVVTLTSSGPLGGELGHLTVPGGLQPRAALGYLSGGLLRLLHAHGAADDPARSLVEAADLVVRLLGDDLDGAAAGLATDLAIALEGRIPFIYGAIGVSGVAAYRWKTQVNENAKIPAVSSLLPELDHNELAGWRRSDQERRISLVALRDRDEHPQVARRFELTKELSLAPTVGEVWSQGESRLARLFSLTTVGDLVSLFLAESADIDPVEVDVLVSLKQRLGEHS